MQYTKSLQKTDEVLRSLTFLRYFGFYSLASNSYMLNVHEIYQCRYIMVSTQTSYIVRPHPNIILYQLGAQ